MKNKYTKIFLFAIIVCVLVCNLFIVPIAAEEDTMILKAGTYRFNDNVSRYGTEGQGTIIPLVFNATANYILGDFSSLINHTVTYSGISFDGGSRTAIDFLQDDYEMYLSYVYKEEDYGGWAYNLGTPDTLNLLLSYGMISQDTYNTFINYYNDGVYFHGEGIKSITLPYDQEVDVSFGTWFIANTNYNEVNGGNTCPTLQDLIQDYNGTWAEFQGMMSTNSTLYEEFLDQKRTAYNDGIVMGERNIINSINSDNDFLSLMDTFLNYRMNNTHKVIEDQLDLVYQNGIDRGTEDGYNNGYYLGYINGYNKAESTELVSGFFGDLLNTPINILNSIILYQISDGGTPADTSDDINITVWGVLVVVVIISLFLILLKIFAGG